MENASKALLIAGSVLIAMLILSVGVYLYINMSKVRERYDKDQEVADITKFNTNFTTFLGRDKEHNPISAYEIVTLINFAKKYEEKSGKEIGILVDNNPVTDVVMFLKNNTTSGNDVKIFKCVGVEYDSEGRVNEIKFKAEN